MYSDRGCVPLLSHNVNIFSLFFTPASKEVVPAETGHAYAAISTLKIFKTEISILKTFKAENF